MSRTFWFLAGSVSGVYAVVKAKRTAENFTPDGVAARVAAVRAGLQVFTDEVNAGRAEREADLFAELRANAAAHRGIEAATRQPPPDPVPAAPPELAESTSDGHR